MKRVRGQDCRLYKDRSTNQACLPWKTRTESKSLYYLKGGYKDERIKLFIAAEGVTGTLRDSGWTLGED